MSVYDINNNGSHSTIFNKKRNSDGKPINTTKHKEKDIAIKKRVTMVGDPTVKYLRDWEDLALKERIVKVIVHSGSTI